MLFSGLTRLASDDTVHLCLADSISVSKDLKHYKILIKKSHWTDGSLCTAHDFERTWKSLLSPSFSSPFAHLLFVIKNAKQRKFDQISEDKVGVKATKPNVLEIELENPTPHFLELLAAFPYFSIHKKYLSKDFPSLKNYSNTLISNGPFRLINWKRNKGMVLEKNPLFWRSDFVHLSKIHVSFIGDINKAFHMYQSGKFDVIGDPISPIPIEAQKKYIKNKILNPVIGRHFLTFNCNAYPFHNIWIRKALSCFIPREKIANCLNIDTYHPANDFMITLGNIKNSQDNLTKGQQYLQKALRELNCKAKDIELELLYENSKVSNLIAKFLKRTFEEVLKIKVSIKCLCFKLLYTNLFQRNYHCSIFHSIAQFIDPIEFLERFKFKSNSKNYADWENRNFVSLLDRATKEQHYPKRLQTLQKAEKILMKDCPISPILNFRYSFLHHPYVKGISIAPNGSMLFENAYIDPKIYAERIGIKPDKFRNIPAYPIPS